MTAAELKASILEQAIRGKLVPQDPSDESAAELLKRIKTEPSTPSTSPCQGKAKTTKGKKIAALPPITDEEKPFEIPESWVWCRLGEVADLIRDGEHKTPHRVAKFCGYYLLSARNIKDCNLDLTEVDYVDELEFAKISKRCFVRYGDVLISCSGSVGRTCLADLNNCVMVRSAALIRGAGFYNKYLMYMLQSVFAQDQIASKQKKTAQANLFLGSIAGLVIPLPPLAEQKAIVEKIEELMPLVERYGKAEERRAKLNATLPADLEKSILQEAFNGAFSGNSEFQDFKLNDVCESICTGNSLSASEKLKYSKASGIPYIGTKDVGFDSCVNYDNGMQIPECEKGFRIAAIGTTLLCVEGGSSGRKIGLLDRNVCYGNKLCAFTPCAKLEPKYLFYYLQSPQFQDQFASLQKGERKGTGVSQVKSLVIPLPPLAEQKAIVAKVEELLAQVRSLRTK